MALTTKEGEHASVIHPYYGMLSTPDVLEFTVELGKDTMGAVGWLYCTDNSQSNKITCTFDAVMNRSIFLNIAERKVFGPTAILEQNMRIDHAESLTKVICQRSGSLGQRDFSITVGDNAKVSASIANCFPHELVRILPIIHFSGKVTVSDVKYALDECL